MAQRVSGYERKERDLYITPAWVTEALIDQAFGADDKPFIWDPAAGDGAITKVFAKRGFDWCATDIAKGHALDFLWMTRKQGMPHPPPSVGQIRAIVTNPPYSLAQEFIEHALDLMKPVSGTVAMLLRIDFDSAKTRRHLFKDCPHWWMKIVLLKRIRWFDGDSSPSENHAWYIWQCNPYWEGPTITYAP